MQKKSANRFCAFLLFLLLGSGFFLACQSKDAKEQKAGDSLQRPNFVFIIADDMAWDDCGAYGHPAIRTPNIDNLARQGMRFDQAYLTTSSCSPSRTSILTGMYPHNTDAEQLHWPLPPGKRTFVEQLKAAGYWTALGGKYHLGEAVKNHFDLIMEVGTAGFQLSADGKESKLEGDGSGCESWLSLLRRRPEDQPFFLWLAAIDPHRPYEEGVIAKPHRAEDVRVPPYLPDTEESRADLALYYDEISRFDEYVGQVMQEIDRQGVSDNTFVLLISDNGRPFPRDKTTLYDGGIKTPWIVRWPNRVEAGSANKNLISSIDIAPTLVALAKGETLQSFSGLNFESMLTAPAQPIREYIYAEDHWHDFEDYTRAVRDLRYKYIRNFYPDLPNTPSADALRSPTFQKMLQMRDAGQLSEAQRACFRKPRPEEELYDLEADPYELRNLAIDPAHTEVLQKMRNALKAIREKTGDQLPAVRTPDEFDRESGQPTPARIRPRPSKAEMMEKRKAKG